MKLPKPGRPVRLLWLDASSTNGWSRNGELPEPVPVITYGFVSSASPLRVTISGSRWMDEGEPVWGENIAIPTGMITSWEYLTDGYE